MEFKRRRMIKSEIDRLLSDEGTRNLLNGIKLVSKNRKFPRRIVTRRVLLGNKSPQNNSKNEKTQQLIKKSLSLLGQSNKLVNSGKSLSNGPSTNSKAVNGVKTNNVTNKGSSPTQSGNNSNNNTASNGLLVKPPKPQFPLLATLVRGHVAFITLSYHNHLCTLRTQDLRDLVRKLEEYESRRGISVIVMNSSSDRKFCDGLDYKELIHTDLNKRKIGVQKRIDAIKNVITALAKSKKLLIASVNSGKVNGFGLILLGLFDLVYANDKATFSIQKYFQMKQPPEGISVFNPTLLQAPTMKSFIFTGKVCTALEMHQNGFLVTEVLWDGSRYHEQLASKLSSVHSLERTKAIYKTYSSKNLKQLGSDIDQEFGVLESTWVSDSWQKSAVQQLHRDRHSYNN